MQDSYGELGKDFESLDIERTRDLKQVYFNFLADFKKYLVEYVRESAIDLSISDIKVSSVPHILFDGEHGGIYITLKNQGLVDCYLTTDRRGGFKLEPGEKEKFWLNAETTIMTVSGETTVGFIRS